MKHLRLDSSIYCGFQEHDSEDEPVCRANNLTSVQMNANSLTCAKRSTCMTVDHFSLFCLTPIASFNLDLVLFFVLLELFA
jgi:hypothetical protein